MTLKNGRQRLGISFFEDLDVLVCGRLKAAMNSAMQINEVYGIGLVVEDLITHSKLGCVAHKVQPVHGLERSLKEGIEIRGQDQREKPARVLNRSFLRDLPG